jgi:hypothetical protein
MLLEALFPEFVRKVRDENMLALLREALLLNNTANV